MARARRKRGGRSRRAPLTRERVLRKAMHLADEGGLQELSMRRLAAELGVEAMSLYHHLANKEAVLDGIAELVVGEIEVPTVGGDWKAEMRKRAASAHQVFMRHPWAVLLVGTRINVGPAMLRYIDATLGCLREAGFSYELADHAWNAMDSHIYGFTLYQLNFPLEPSEYASAAAGFLPLLPADRYPYMRALAELVIAGGHSGLHDLHFGLDLLLEGLDRLLRQGSRS